MAKETFVALISDKQYKQAAELILANEDLLEIVMRDFFTEDLRYIQMVANVFEELKKENQHLLLPYFSEWIERLKTPPHNAFWRNSYRYFQEVDIPEEHQGTLYDLAYKDMMKAKSPIAIKAFAMKTCVNIAKNYPELLPELREAITIVSDSDSPGVRSRSKHMIAEIDRLI